VVAPVKLDGVALLRVRGISSFPAEKRAALIAGASRRSRPTGAFRPARCASKKRKGHHASWLETSWCST